MRRRAASTCPKPDAGPIPFAAAFHCNLHGENDFTGFTDSETFTQIPDSFFRQLLNEIDEADELKVTLYALWRFEHMEGRLRFLQARGFLRMRA